MNFFKLSESLKFDAMQNLEQVVLNFDKEFFRRHGAFESANLFQNLKFTNLEYKSSQHKDLARIIEVHGKDYNSECTTNISVEEDGKEIELNAFSVFITRNGANCESLNLQNFYSEILITQHYHMRDELVSTTAISAEKQLRLLSLNFSKYNLRFLFNDSLSTDAISKAINIKEFRTNATYNLEMCKNDNSIVYTGALTTTLDCGNVKLKKRTESTYILPLVLKKEVLGEDEMFKILINSSTFAQFIEYTICYNLDNNFPSRAVLQLHNIIVDTIRSQIGLLGKYTSSYEFGLFCENSDELDEFLSNCFNFSKTYTRRIIQQNGMF